LKPVHVLFLQKKKVVLAKTIFDSLTTRQFSNVLFPMTYKANRTFLDRDVEIATVGHFTGPERQKTMLVIKRTWFLCDFPIGYAGRKHQETGARKSLSR
jgi:hypothetical protein